MYFQMSPEMACMRGGIIAINTIDGFAFIFLPYIITYIFDSGPDELHVNDLVCITHPQEVEVHPV